MNVPLGCAIKRYTKLLKDDRCYPSFPVWSNKYGAPMTAQSSPLLYEEIQAMQIYETILLFGSFPHPNLTCRVQCEHSSLYLDLLENCGWHDSIPHKSREPDLMKLDIGFNCAHTYPRTQPGKLRLYCLVTPLMMNGFASHLCTFDFKRSS